jgi:UDP-N-acetylglucosamine 4,6-dehydratase/5-epimerase
MNVFITGGSGTLGRELVRQLADTAEKIVIYSRDESKQAAMKAEFPETSVGNIRYRIGDIRDIDRMRIAMHDCDTVIHAAAMKRIDTCETEVYECLKTNIDGTANVAKLCNELGIAKAVFISTDKACDPISAYGAAKAFSEHLWVQSNNYGPCRFNVVRYGNVRGSKGSIHEQWESKRGQRITVTSPEMTRYFWNLEDAAAFCLWALDSPSRGIILAPKMCSFRIIEIARQYSFDIEITGLRCNEKLHERLVCDSDIVSGLARDIGNAWAIFPHNHDWDYGQTPYGKMITETKGVTSEI